jgi:thioredoxin-related protein
MCQDFRLLTVNAADSAKLIQLFVKKTKAKFPILARGEEVAKKYGVTGYPTVVLLGKDGRVLYSGSFEQAIIEGLIDRNL